MSFKCNICCIYTTKYKGNLEKHLLGKETRRCRSNESISYQIKKQLHELYPYKHNVPLCGIKSNSKVDYSSQINIQNQTNNNNDQRTYNLVINNNITLHPYTNPDESMLTKEEMEKLLNNLPFSAPQMFRKIYLNEDVPQNHVVYKNNIGSNKVMVLSEDGWINIKDRQLFDFFKQKYHNNVNNYLSYKDFSDGLTIDEYDHKNSLLEQYEKNNQVLINEQILTDLKKKRQLSKEKHRATKDLNPEELQTTIAPANGIHDTEWMKDRNLLMETMESRSFGDFDMTDSNVD